MKNYKFDPKLILLTFLFLIREDTNAQSPDWLWVKTMGEQGYDAGHSIAVDPITAAVYTTGTFNGTVDFNPGPDTHNVISEGFPNMFISKLNSAGTFAWAKAIRAISNYISIDPETGAIYTTGSFSGVVDFDPGPDTFHLSSPEYPYSYTSMCYDYDCDCYVECIISGVTVIPAMFISKLDTEGNFMWAKALPGSDQDSYGDSYAVVATSAGSGNVYTTGRFFGTVDFDPGPGSYLLTSVGTADIFISKLDISGNFVWAKAIGGNGGDVSYSIAIDPTGNGGVYTTGGFAGTVDFDPGPGTFHLSANGIQIFISKLDSSGNFVWAKTMTGYDFNFGHAIAVDTAGSGDVYTTGVFGGIVDFNPGPGTFDLTSSGVEDVFVSKLDLSGNFVWAKSMGGTGSEKSLSLALDPGGSGEVYTTGSFTGAADFDPGDLTFHLTSAGSEDLFISKLDGSGNFVFAKEAGGEDGDYGRSISLNPSGSGEVYVTGYFLSPSILFDTVVLDNHETVNIYYDKEGNEYEYITYTSDVFVAKFGGCTGTVTSTGNQGNGTLREIIACAAPGATIDFALAPMSQITLTSGEIEIHKNLIISGSGMLNLSLSGNNASRIFHVLPGKNLEIENITLKNATSLTNGGALYSEGNLTLKNVLLQNNFQNGMSKGFTISPGGFVTVVGNVGIKN